MKYITLLKITLIAFLIPAFAKEPTNIMLGVGFGAGESEIEITHSQVINDPILNYGNSTPRWPSQQNKNPSSWAFAWEFLLGYKHFINDFVGFRYYGNLGIQHYTPLSLNSKEQKIGFVDYTLNADLLIDFWESEFIAVGIFGGMGFGGTSFDKKAIAQYMAVYNVNSARPIGLADVKRHFFNVNANVGARVTFFQKVRQVEKRACDKYKDGKRTCRVPIYYIGHSVELNAKFPLLDYQATPWADIIIQGSANGGNNNQTLASRPGYKVKNPYRITLRYVVDF
ncbi:outer membrane beta-barrel protein [Helicobacter sp. 23-1045]